MILVGIFGVQSGAVSKNVHSILSGVDMCSLQKYNTKVRISLLNL